ncbi:MAG: VOC family protein [Acidimicrobiales bacterium]
MDVLQVPDGMAVENRVHLDLRADGSTDADELGRLRALGARPADVGQSSDATWVVLADPEGNEFCLLLGTS